MKRLVPTAVTTALGAALLVVPASGAHANGAPTTDFALTATGPERATPGETVEYVLTVTNKGPAAAATVVNLWLPKGTSAITYASRPVTSQRVLLNTFNPGEVREVRIAARIGNQNDEMTLPASFTANRGFRDRPLYQDSDNGNNHASVDTVNEKGDPLQGPDSRLGLTGEITGGNQAGDLVTQRLTFTNTGRHRTEPFDLMGHVYPGSGDITEVTGLEDATGLASTRGLQYTVPRLDPGKTRVVAITTKIMPPGSGGIGGMYYAGDLELDLRR
ncbi:hypothetical protein JNUCC64_05880 [Streptomyces sp. JNUCC 64]